MRKRNSNRLLASVLSVFMVVLGVQASVVSAAVVDTGTMVSEYAVEQDREALRNAMADDQVRDRLVELGVSPAEVDARIDALTPSELAMLQAEMDEMPAGSGALGLLALLVLIFFITDILGVTDIFPFVNPAN